MKTDDKENKSVDQKGTDGGETSKSNSKDATTSAQQEPQPSTSSTFPNSPESSNALESKDALFEVNCAIFISCYKFLLTMKSVL